MKITTWLTHKEIECWNFSESNRQRLQAAIPQAEITVCQTRDKFLGELGDTDIVMVWTFRQEWLQLAPKLKWIATPAAGKDYFHVTPPESVRMTYGTFHGELMGETMIGMILGAARGLFATADMQNRVMWPRKELSPLMQPLRGKHLAILGFGRIGNWIGKLAKPFGMRITGIKRTISQAPDYFEPGDRIATMNELDSVLAETDHLAIALPSDTGTDDMIDARRIALMPDSACIYNIGRGNCIDEKALAKALDEGRLAFACLDVFKEEPLPDDSPLRKCKNILLMPHASAVSPNYLDLYLDEFIEDCRRFQTQS